MFLKSLTIPPTYGLAYTHSLIWKKSNQKVSRQRFNQNQEASKSSIGKIYLKVRTVYIKFTIYIKPARTEMDFKYSQPPDSYKISVNTTFEFQIKKTWASKLFETSRIID